MAYAAIEKSTTVSADHRNLWAQLRAAYQRRRLYQQTVAELSRLTTRELADLGLSRSMITAAAREAAYGK